MPLLLDALLLVLLLAGLHVALQRHAREQRSGWQRALLDRRAFLLCALALALTAVKVSEDVLNAESGEFDHAVMLSLHAHAGPELLRVFEWITDTASFRGALLLAATASLFMLRIGCVFSAGLITLSTSAGAGVVWLLKTLVGRERPALWETQWYWGSSFPSGHTLVAAALAVALVMSVRRHWPAWQRLSLLLASTWVLLVGVSRLALGVHWPTDVIAAACMGALLALTLAMVLEAALGTREGRTSDEG